MSKRRCTGCNAPMSTAESSCRICGRIQLPYSGQGSITDETGLGRILTCGMLIVLSIALIGWLFIRLGA
jgi:hypothetical protein